MNTQLETTEKYTYSPFSYWLSEQVSIKPIYENISKSISSWGGVVGGMSTRLNNDEFDENCKARMATTLNETALEFVLPNMLDNKSH